MKKMPKAALITGGSRRIGKSISIQLSELGYDIALHFNSSAKEAYETKILIENKGVNCEIFKCDISDTKEVLKLLQKVLKKLPHTNLLINNASIFEQIGFLNVSLKDFERDFNTNFKAPFFLTQSFAKLLSRGMVINLLDARVSKIHTAHFVYNISKKALYHFTLMAAKELGPKIRVNAICPGPILPVSGEDNKHLTKLANKTPLKKLGDTSYINLAIKYLIENPFVTGEILFVDGGQHL